MAKQEQSPEEARKVVVRIKKAADDSGQMSLFGEAARDRTRPLNVEERLMLLLGVKSLEELNRVLSEPPDESALETMESPYDLYDLEAEDDLINDGLYEIENSEKEGIDTILVMKDGATAVHEVSNPAPQQLRLIREFSSRPYRILPKPLELDRCNCMWLTFARRGKPDEFLIYEEL